MLCRLPFGSTKILLTICLVLSCLYYFQNHYKQIIAHTERFLHYLPVEETNRKFLVDTPGCRIPKLNPFDKTVRKFYSPTSGAFNCGPQEPLFYVRENGMVSIDEKALISHYEVSMNEIDCFYYPIIRNGSEKKPDNNFILGSKRHMVFNQPMEDDCILINCSRAGKLFTTDILPLTPIKVEVEEKCQAAMKNSRNYMDKLNIIILGIDSISKLNFLRYFSKTMRLLESNFSVIELNGYTKVGDNSYPNLVSLLTGNNSDAFATLNKNNEFYDDVDFIWKKYSVLGYRTLYSEDYPEYGTFVYEKTGFQNPPTDYYTRPFSVAAQNLNIRRNRDCFGSRMEMRAYYDYLRNFVSTMGDRPIFAFTFVSRLTHNTLENAGYADQPTYELLHDLKETGIFNTSLFIFFSDHGIRYGDIRQTYIGKIEERMPFLFLNFPTWFLQQNPEFSRNLRINRNRLVTLFDVHATLLHLLEPFKKKFTTLHGQSLLTEISPERTCDDASIGKHWCVCSSQKVVSTEDKNVQTAAFAVIEHLNRLLMPFSNECALLKLQKVLDARVSQPSEELLGSEKVVGRDYFITLYASPSSAVFEATVEMKNNQYKVIDDVSRLNKYGDQSICIQDITVRKYCYCNNGNS